MLAFCACYFDGVLTIDEVFGAFEAVTGCYLTAPFGADDDMDS